MPIPFGDERIRLESVQTVGDGLHVCVRWFIVGHGLDLSSRPGASSWLRVRHRVFQSRAAAVVVIGSVGHGTLPANEFADLLLGAGIEMVVDVRRYPGSRRWPHFAKGQLEGWLPALGVQYRWLEGLGGRRQGVADSPNIALRNPQFRAYADYMSSGSFAASVDELLGLASTRAVTVMCAESLWWRCHRRLLADHLVLVDGIEVGHLLHDGRVTEHEVTEGARRDRRQVVYDEGVLL
jgi:hypothetical protein